ncbi:hypothetical protein N566_28030 [Streptomycetaceae bacterium MP113-05]|nr:hypothetical protein N566_28030 [Streptomycetaceae bacterium MP113-05]
MKDTRTGPSPTSAEREMLRDFLDYHRDTLAMKCEGLSDAELRLRSMPPSTLSLLALVRHMAEVERAWFRRTINGEDIGWVWSDGQDYQEAFRVGAATGAQGFAAWRVEVEHSRRIERGAESLDLTGYHPKWESEVSLRMVMLHLIHEYARHNGHADLLREGVDGATGA